MPSLPPIGLAVPASVPQSIAADLAVALNCPDSLSGANPKQESFLRRVFERTGIESRGCVVAGELREFYPLPKDASDRGPTTEIRMKRYAEEAPVLGERASRDALAGANLLPKDITHLITVSCTGFFAPGLDIALIERLELSPTVSRTLVGFMGCHAALNALAVANGIIALHPNAKVLLCCVELCTLHFGYGFTPDRIIANSLFADGAAATVLTAVRQDAPYSLLSTATKFLPGTKQHMTWNIGNHGYEMTLSPEVPTLIGSAIRPWLESWLPRHELKIEQVPHWAIHPGGPKVLASAAAALNLTDAALAHSKHILAKHGNMSSATILFILNQLKTPGHIVSLGFGPGLMMEGALLRRN